MRSSALVRDLKINISNARLFYIVPCSNLLRKMSKEEKVSQYGVWLQHVALDCIILRIPRHDSYSQMVLMAYCLSRVWPQFVRNRTIWKQFAGRVCTFRKTVCHVETRQRANLRSPPANQHFVQAIRKVDINYFDVREQFVPVIAYSFGKTYEFLEERGDGTRYEIFVRHWSNRFRTHNFVQSDKFIYLIVHKFIYFFIFILYNVLL